MPEWRGVSVEEAAKLTGYHPEHIRRLLRQGKIEAVKIGTVYLIKYDSLIGYVDEMRATGDGRAGPHDKR